MAANRGFVCRVAARFLKWRGPATALLSAVLFTLPCAAFATEAARPAYSPPPPAVSSGSVVQIIFSLFLVLAAIVLAAWLLKRINIAQQGAGQQIRVLGGVPIGQRERIVLVEVGDTWLVIGVGPGQIRTLHTLPKSEDAGTYRENPSTNAQPSENRFAGLLSSLLNRRKQGTDGK